MKKWTRMVTGLLLVLVVAVPHVAGQVKKASKPKAAAVTAEDLQALREALAAQQEQIRQLQQELRTRDEANRQAMESLRQAQASALAANTKAASAESAANQTNTSLDQVKADIADVKLNQQNAAVSTQDDQKRWGALEGVLGRFRLSGDIRLRYENFFQDYAGCSSCSPRHRMRIRLRMGVDGKLSEDFLGGFAFATGDLTDPISTNVTLTPFFERKAIGVDRAFITFQPQAHKWLQITGGKFAFTWNRTQTTFDSDLNPEGFSEKLSFDLAHPVLKNVNVTGLQLMVNEVSGSQDATAFGGSLSGKVAAGKRVTLIPTFTVLKWKNPSQIARGIATGTYVSNRNTNSTVGTGANVAYGSQFLYTNYLLEAQVKTSSDRFPLRILGEFQNNLEASTSQGQAASLDLSLGQVKQRGDYIFGYAFARIEQDAVIAAFADSDMRAPTNVLQHKVYFNYQVMPNTTLAYTGFFGRTLNRNLQNAATAPGSPAGVDPTLKRMQFDIIYKF